MIWGPRMKKPFAHKCSSSGLKFDSKGSTKIEKEKRLTQKWIHFCFHSLMGW